MRAGRALRTIVASAAIGIAITGLSIGEAAAAWIQLNDPDTVDSATNPGYPGNQSADTVGSYLQDFLDLSSAPDFIGKNDSYGGATLTGLGDPDPGDVLLLAFHFGNGNDYWPHTGQFDVFFGCASDCDSFTLPSTKGVSNYRLYGSSDTVTELRVVTQTVPEPATLALLGAGALCIALQRRRRRD
jgi:hypothetical protein